MPPESPQTSCPPLLAEIATTLWRMRRRVDGASIGSEAQLRRMRRDLESLWTMLQQAGVEVLDHTGERYHPGTSLKIIAFQTEPEGGERQILETLKPTVYYQQERLQMGEVIVGDASVQAASLSANNLTPVEET